MLTHLLFAALTQGLLPPASPAVGCDPFLILLDAGSARVPARYHQMIDTIASLKGQVRSHMTVDGFADAKGSTAYNLKLSRRRAEAVKAALIARGVPKRSIVVGAHGESYPMQSTKGASAEAMSRRVSVCFY